MTPASAQTRIGLRAGASLSSILVRDSITEPLTVRPRPGPGLTLVLETGLDSLHRLELAVTTSWSRLVEHAGGSTREIVSLGLWQPALTVDRRIGRGVSARASLGALLYRPDETEATMFSRGSPVVPFIGIGLGAERQVAGITGTLTVSYDLHRFTTAALREAGFTGERPVHRITGSIGVKRAL